MNIPAFKHPANCTEIFPQRCLRRNQIRSGCDPRFAHIRKCCWFSLTLMFKPKIISVLSRSSEEVSLSRLMFHLSWKHLTQGLVTLPNIHGNRLNKGTKQILGKLPWLEEKLDWDQMMWKHTMEGLDFCVQLL